MYATHNRSFVLPVLPETPREVSPQPLYRGSNLRSCLFGASEFRLNTLSIIQDLGNRDMCSILLFSPCAASADLKYLNDPGWGRVSVVDMGYVPGMHW
jgi:hypothetical protein